MAEETTQSLTVDDEMELGWMLPDIAKDAGVSVDALAAEIRANRMRDVERSAEEMPNNPAEWAVSPVGIAGWLARDDTPENMWAPLRDFFGRNFSTELCDAATQAAAQDAIDEAADAGTPLADFAARIGVSAAQIETEMNADRLVPSVDWDFVSPTDVKGWLDSAADDAALRPAMQSWFDSHPEPVKQRATEWAANRAQLLAEMLERRGGYSVEGDAAQERPRQISPKAAEKRRKDQNAQKAARRNNRRR